MDDGHLPAPKWASFRSSTPLGRSESRIVVVAALRGLWPCPEAIASGSPRDAIRPDSSVARSQPVRRSLWLLVTTCRDCVLWTGPNAECTRVCHRSALDFTIGNPPTATASELLRDSAPPPHGSSHGWTIGPSFRGRRSVRYGLAKSDDFTHNVVFSETWLGRSSTFLHILDFHFFVDSVAAHNSSISCCRAFRRSACEGRRGASSHELFDRSLDSSGGRLQLQSYTNACTHKFRLHAPTLDHRLVLSTLNGGLEEPRRLPWT